ncbi:MAG: hypothetical protein ACRD0I_11940 [Acidimicrobiales bacterium]
MERVCESCAAEDEELAAVYRVYVTPETWDQPGSATRVIEPELWCFTCRSMYPHESADDDTAAEDDTGDEAES